MNNIPFSAKMPLISCPIHTVGKGTGPYSGRLLIYDYLGWFISLNPKKIPFTPEVGMIIELIKQSDGLGPIQKLTINGTEFPVG